MPGGKESIYSREEFIQGSICLRRELFQGSICSRAVSIQEQYLFKVGGGGFIQGQYVSTQGCYLFKGRDYKHWTQDTSTRDPKTQGPEDWGPGDPRTQSLESCVAL